MKKVILATMMLVLISTVSFAGRLVAEGKTHSRFGDYRLELAENTIEMNGTDCKTYKIVYENTPMDVTVVVCRDKAQKCMRYVVLTDKVSVQYVCNDTYFGVQKLAEGALNEGHSTSDNFLNKSEYFHQKVLSPGHVNEKEATMLVAAYFPFLVKEESTASR